VLSTMQDVPLTVTRILAHGTVVHGKSTVTTWTGEGEPRLRTFREVGERAVRLANALRDELGVDRGDRVATLMWNSVAKTLCR
jgi:fatty-acyl-CoA synthase